MKFSLLSGSLIVLSALFDSYAAFIVKTKFNTLGPIPLESFSSFAAYILKFVRDPLLATAAATFVLAPGLWFLALNRIHLSVGYPMLVGFHLFFVLIFGVFFLGEVLTVNRMIGIGFIIISLYFINS